MYRPCVYRPLRFRQPWLLKHLISFEYLCGTINLCKIFKRTFHFPLKMNGQRKLVSHTLYSPVNDDKDIDIIKRETFLNFRIYRKRTLMTITNVYVKNILLVILDDSITALFKN